MWKQVLEYSGSPSQPKHRTGARMPLAFWRASSTILTAQSASAIVSMDVIACAIIACCVLVQLELAVQIKAKGKVTGSCGLRVGTVACELNV
jgi:hypothetical protein